MRGAHASLLAKSVCAGQKRSNASHKLCSARSATEACCEPSQCVLPAHDTLHARKFQVKGRPGLFQRPTKIPKPLRLHQLVCGVENDNPSGIVLLPHARFYIDHLSMKPQKLSLPCGDPASSLCVPIRISTSELRAIRYTQWRLPGARDAASTVSLTAQLVRTEQYLYPSNCTTHLQKRRLEKQTNTTISITK